MSDVNPFLSEDIWFEIFKKLAVKTLGKCRCVCKSWHSLVVSPSFMAAHHKHYTQNHANSLILCKEIFNHSETEEESAQCIVFRNSDQLKQGNSLHTSVCPFVVRQTSTAEFHFVGCVNGLLCISESNYYLGLRHCIMIWNPLIQKLIKLPKSSFRGRHSLVGFGYDYQRNDHRVVKISYSAENTPFVEVYSVQERKWRTICADYLVDNLITDVSPSPCFCNGLIYWPILSRQMGTGLSFVECLLLYNVAEERFAKIELPEEIVNCSCFGHFGIFEYYGMLSVSHCQYMFLEMSTTTHCQIWVKRDCNVQSSWSKIVNDCVSYGYRHERPLEYLGANKELVGFINENTGQLVSYNPNTGQITELGFSLSQSTKFCAYSESLALLDQKTDKRTAAELKRCVNHRRGFNV